MIRVIIRYKGIDLDPEWIGLVIEKKDMEPSTSGFPHPTTQKPQIHVLLVEDDLGAQQLVRHALTRMEGTEEYVLEMAQDLASATKAIQSRRFDNILLDLALPDSHGVETVSKVRQMARDIPILVLSALSEPEYGIKAIQSGADYYLPKGTIAQQFLGPSIRYCIERKRLQSTAARPIGLPRPRISSRFCHPRSTICNNRSNRPGTRMLNLSSGEFARIS